MLTACLAILCVLLMLVLLVQRPAIWPVLVVLATAWCIGMGLFRYRLRSQLARWVCGGDFTKSKTKFSLEPLSQPVVLLSGETVLWYNDQFRQRIHQPASDGDGPTDGDIIIGKLVTRCLGSRIDGCSILTHYKNL